MKGWTKEHIKPFLDEAKSENHKNSINPMEFLSIRPRFDIAEPLSNSTVYDKTSSNVLIAQRIPVKPLSVNQAWQGRRYKTDAYKQYESVVKAYLEDSFVPEGKYELYLLWGLSTKSADFDNPVKLFVDLLQKKYGFNDKHIVRCVIEKVCVKKGNEFIEFQLNLL